MNVSSQPLFASASQPPKLPIPRLPSLSTPSWTSSSTSTNPIIPNAQQTDNATQQQTTNKPQNKRGRKPLSSMPTTKKHIQNLNNQRAFRQRRETYIRSLETKATKFEELLKVARNELENLKERVALLEEQVDIEERINICNGVSDLQMVPAVTDENIRTHNIVHNDNGNSFNDNSNNVNNVNDNLNTSCCDQQSRCLPPFATNTLTFNDQHRLINQPPQISCGVPMLPPLENVDAIRDPIFCETREGDLCFCEPINEQNITTTNTNTTVIDKRSSGDKSVDKQMWILPTTIPSSLYSNYSPNLELSHQQDYFSPAVSSVVTKTSSFYPLNLKWILSDSG
ncbi:hypothetical protein RclHR1_22350002 [Rhizophagus clarus]|uniref:BZIP transcription factor AP-1/Yap1, putative n=1 Tax=Rhizophagus clarus TaxID=94130 RepID=A0A2Z6R7T3_9GLOM|nr:hypothetical protein RclHR1_22350002 [Rhizophagus clarus]GES93075.1 bZIP transcription factor AP-1/Yap1, putative [Rhizophagus clarus]